MNNDEPKKKISDNPSTEEMKQLLLGLQALGGVTGFEAKVDDMMKQADIFDLPDRFNAAFGERGWIAVGGAMSVDVMKEALKLHGNGKPDEAEDVLVEWFTEDHIKLFAILRARRFHEAELRDDQLEEALQLYLEERYMAAVPLILIACDGFASDVAPVSPFEKDADLSCFDSITGHDTSLPALIKLITKGVRKSRDDEIDMPLRHGILHGRSLGYANKKVCAKAWLLMMALVDWATDKSSEEERRREYEERQTRTLADDLRSLEKTRTDKRIIDAFEPYEKGGPFEEPLAPDGPEMAATEFLSGWKAKNYGKMGKVAVNLVNKPANRMAGELRLMAEYIELLDYEIKSIRYATVARCDVRIWARAKTLTKDVEGEFMLMLARYNDEGNVAMPGDDGHWTVQQNCIYNIMNEKLA